MSTRLAAYSYLLVLTLLLTSCGSTYSLYDLNYPLAEIQKAVGSATPGGVKSVSPNQREFLSGYFEPAEVFSDWDPQYIHKPTQRALSRASILGDRRPYKVEVTVDIEERDNESTLKKSQRSDLRLGNFVPKGSNSRLSEKVGRLINDYLLRRGQSKNMIDDFRPF